VARQGKPRPRTPENVRSFWESEASELGGTPQVSIRDLYFRIHELHTLLALIPRTGRLLDAGCGNGFGTVILSRRAQFTLGVDYSANMIRWADRLVRDAAHRARISREFSPFWALPHAEDDEVAFLEADVREPIGVTPPFDVLTAQRLLINLTSAADRRQALAALRGSARAGSLLVLCETTLEGFDRTDAYRARFGLPGLERHWHNSYLDESETTRWSDLGWTAEVQLGFETYTLLSKVVYPAASPTVCEFLSGANRAAMEVAGLFRSRGAVEEVGRDAFFRIYTDRVGLYDPGAADAISVWLRKHGRSLPDWNGLGHHRLIVGHAS
jgi:SAM-dependent methyltransferase